MPNFVEQGGFHHCSQSVHDNKQIAEDDEIFRRFVIMSFI
jgi:hypothetical protein